MNNARWKIVAVLIAVVLVSILIVPRLVRRSSVRQAEQLLDRTLPTTYPLLTTTAGELPTAINLPVPFTTQAPFSNWDLPYQEACEEASALMEIRYVFGNSILSSEDADAAILDLVKTNEEILQYPYDQTAKQVQELISEIDSAIKTRLITDPTIEELKREIASGNVIIVPAAGRLLRNPFFNRPGPVYHMLVLRGYTSDGYFITNEPGTKRGEGYLYTLERIMDAMHDWNGGEVENGQKIVIVVEPFSEVELEQLPTRRE